jgi:hypothetical protein
LYSKEKVFKRKGKRVCFALAQTSQDKCDLGKFKVVGILKVEG